MRRVLISLRENAREVRVSDALFTGHSLCLELKRVKQFLTKIRFDGSITADPRGRNTDALASHTHAFKASIFSDSDQVLCERRSARNQMHIIKPPVKEAARRTQAQHILSRDIRVIRATIAKELSNFLVVLAPLDNVARTALFGEGAAGMAHVVSFECVMLGSLAYSFTGASPVVSPRRLRWPALGLHPRHWSRSTEVSMVFPATWHSPDRTPSLRSMDDSSHVSSNLEPALT